MLIANRSQFNASVRQFLAGFALHEQSLPAVAAVSSMATLTNLFSASRARQQGFQQSRDEKRDAFITQQSAKEAGQAFIEKSRDNLVSYLGSDWSEAWTPAGFINHSLAIPQSIPRVIDTLEALEGYYTRNASHARADLSLTAQFARQHRNNLEAAVSTVAQCKREQRANRDLREAADTSLADKLAAARKVLAAVMSEDDSRWLDFRTDVPGDLNRPDSVEGVEWQAGMAGHITVRWESAARAESYVVQVLNVGVDAAFRNVVTVHDTVADLSFVPGAQVRVRVLARNASGPAVPSDEIIAQVPAAVAA